MKKICISLKQFFYKIKSFFKRKHRYYIDLSDIEDLSHFNLEKNKNIFNNRNTYVPPKLIESKLSDSFSLSDNEELLE